MFSWKSVIQSYLLRIHFKGLGINAFFVLKEFRCYWSTHFFQNFLSKHLLPFYLYFLINVIVFFKWFNQFRIAIVYCLPIVYFLLLLSILLVTPIMFSSDLTYSYMCQNMCSLHCLMPYEFCFCAFLEEPRFHYYRVRFGMIIVSILCIVVLLNPVYSTTSVLKSYIFYSTNINISDLQI